MGHNEKKHNTSLVAWDAFEMNWFPGYLYL